MKKINLGVLSAIVFGLVACSSGSSNSTQNPAQQFATIVNNQISLLESSGTSNNPIIVGYAAFPAVGSSTQTQAYLLSYIESSVPYTDQSMPPPNNFAIYYAPVLSSYSNYTWSSRSIPFSSPNTIISSMAINNSGMYIVAESYTYSGSGINSFSQQLYLYANSKLTEITNPFDSECNINCNINTIVSTANNIYVAGNSDNVTKIYQYDGSSWTNLMNMPTSQVVINSLTVDKAGTVYASGIESNTYGYLAKYVNGSWQQMNSAIESSTEQSIVFNGSSLFNLAVASGNYDPYFLYQQTDGVWNKVGAMADNFIAQLSFGQLSNDLYGNIYFNGLTSPIKSSSQNRPLAELIYVNK